MWLVEYYTAENGRQPVAEWRDGLDKNNKAKIAAKIQKLGECGLQLLGTTMLERISGDDHDLYELIGGQCRIAIYYDRRRDTFVLLHGFLKKGRTEPRQIETARRRLRSYLSAQGGQFHG